MRDESTAKQDRSAGVTSSVPWRVVDVRVLANFALSVRFADGTEGEVDLSRLVLGPNAGVFVALRDGAVFAQVSVEDGVVSWPGGLDLAPDAMYDAIRAYGRWTVV